MTGQGIIAAGITIGGFKWAGSFTAIDLIAATTNALNGALLARLARPLQELHRRRHPGRRANGRGPVPCAVDRTARDHGPPANTSADRTPARSGKNCCGLSTAATALGCDIEAALGNRTIA